MGSFAWAPDSDTLYFNAPERAEQPVFKTSVSKPQVEKVLGGMNDDLEVTPDGKSLVLTRMSLVQPAESIAWRSRKRRQRNLLMLTTP